MTTDITELAQSLKAAANKATPGRWEYYPGNTSIEYNVDSMDEDQGSIVYVDSGDFTQAQTDRNGEFIALANPANVLALVEALEKAQKQIVELQQGCENDPRTHEIIDLKERIDNLESFRTAYMEWGDKTDWVQTDKRFDALKPWGKHRADVLKAYIEHLESSTVTIEPFRAFVTDADLAALHRFAECCDDPESGGHDLEKEQVRRLESIGALQRSGRISYITGFGNFLISITAGIKWEAE
ncbi:ead/Ea22-like family protein [Klebsiella aerogenes]|uniref:ead/Ea22-like family protein n=1 Tax=Klebsiella aerogenes TaxID=548 RepID=UPI0013D19AC4|nr:ead/Ea22-like family protein [Klebsiella aerogenes]